MVISCVTLDKTLTPVAWCSHLQRGDEPYFIDPKMYGFLHFTSLKSGCMSQLMVCCIFKQSHFFFLGGNKIMMYIMIDTIVGLLKYGIWK